MSKCVTCEHFNLHYHLDEHPRTRGQWGTCVFPYRVNIDDISELRELKENGIVKEKKVWKVDSCKHYMPAHAYGSW